MTPMEIVSRLDICDLEGVQIHLGAATAIQDIWSEALSMESGLFTVVSPFLGMDVEEHLWPLIGSPPLRIDMALVTGIEVIPPGLEALLQLVTTKGHLEVIRVSKLHAKVVAYSGGFGSTAYIGSANLTHAGLARNLEAGAVLRSPPNGMNDPIRGIHEFFRSLNTSNHHATQSQRRPTWRSH